MESTSAKPSTVFSIVTRRHSTEQQAMEKAMSFINSKVEEHKVTSPDADIVRISSKAVFAKGYGFTATVAVTVSVPDASE